MGVTTNKSYWLQIWTTYSVFQGLPVSVKLRACLAGAMGRCWETTPKRTKTTKNNNEYL